MTKPAGLLALAGLALAALLFVREGAGSVLALVMAAGPGLVLAALFHVVPMTANARAWQRLFAASARPALGVLTWATWVREAVNGLLPVARIGGEIVAYRIVRRHAARPSDAMATLVADMALSLLSQAAFALAGLALLVGVGRESTLGSQLTAGIVAMIPLGVGFVLAQRARALGALVRVLDRIFAGRLEGAHAKARDVDDALGALYARHRDVGACLGWQLAAWVLGAGELWLALRFLGAPRGVLDVVALEALIQAASSAAFVVPAALGVQEGAFVVIGAALGLDPVTALALATARRLRDVVVFFPGLLAWHRSETRTRDPESSGA